ATYRDAERMNPSPSNARTMTPIHRRLRPKLSNVDGLSRRVPHRLVSLATPGALLPVLSRRRRTLSREAPIASREASPLTRDHCLCVGLPAISVSPLR